MLLVTLVFPVPEVTDVSWNFVIGKAENESFFFFDQSYLENEAVTLTE